MQSFKCAFEGSLQNPNTSLWAKLEPILTSQGCIYVFLVAKVAEMKNPRYARNLKKSLYLMPKEKKVEEKR